MQCGWKWNSVYWEEGKVSLKMKGKQMLQAWEVEQCIQDEGKVREI